MAAVDATAAAPATVTAAGQPDTPALRQYLAAKRQHPDCLVLFRLGDFFEIFGEDAVRAAPLLGVTLTGRDFGKGGRMPMCGVPHQSLEGYARRLLDAGLRVAVCDQVEAARPGGKLVDRRVVRVLTSGTLVEESLLDPKRSRRCAAVLQSPSGTGAAVIDFSTGECTLLTLAARGEGRELADELIALETAELVHPDGGSSPGPGVEGIPAVGRPAGHFDRERGFDLLRGAGVAPPGGVPEELVAAAAGALSAVVSYGEEGSLSPATSLLRPSWRAVGAVMQLDSQTRRNLEVVEPLTTAGRSLFQLLDHTLTSPGGRRLRSWLASPLTDLGQIHDRQQAVRVLLESESARAWLRAALGGCRDLERLLARCVHGAAGPRDLSLLAQTVAQAPAAARAIEEMESTLLGAARTRLEEAPLQLAARLSEALVENPPVGSRDGGFVRAGFDHELDDITRGSASARQYISELEAKERARTGIRGLKVGYNRVFGYYIEVRGSASEQLPPEYVRRQTLVGAERYLTAELKEQETVVLTAKERSQHREQEILAALVREVADLARPVGAVAAALAELDALQSMAQVGSERGWVLPEIDESRRLEIHEARHPLVEDALGAGRFVPNDTVMDGETERIWLITGPNMAGKSTFLRQVALICLIGQVGAPVPCRQARWGVVDRIFTRVGAQDDLAGGRSTFMVEMEELASILRQASPRSLVVLDEIGRGTSTYDGMSIAQAVLEYLHDTPGVAARVLFSTHYHELTALARLAALRNYRAEVTEAGEGSTASVTFLHTIVPGGADRSYGLNVAQLAGIPEAVVGRAAQILAAMERDRPVAAPQRVGEQLALPLVPTHPMVEEVRGLQIDAMTPLEALQKIAAWQRSADGRS